MIDFDIQDGVLTWYKGEAESVVIPREVTRIGVEAFRDSELVSVELHEGITRIHRRAFMNCFRLREVVIPDSVTRIDSDAFSGCAALESVRLPAGLDALRSGVFVGCTALKSIELPEQLKLIGPVAFCDCAALESVSLPEGLEEIGERAFGECARLRLSALPAHLKRLWTWAFEDSPIPELTVGGELVELRDFMVPFRTRVIYAPEHRLEDYLRGLNTYNDETEYPYHILEYGEGDRWRIDREGEAPCLRRIK